MSRGDILNERYSVVDIIGRGTQAAVLLVTDTKENNEKYKILYLNK
jgi:hypothetical protein